MRTSQSFSYFNDKIIDRDEMKRILAGDDLPPVTVSSSYSRVWHMDYYSYLMLYGYGGPGFTNNTGGGGGGGGGGAPNTTGTFLASNFSADMNAFLSALSLSGSVNGSTFDLTVFLNKADNLTILRNLSHSLSWLGIGLNVNELIDHYVAGSLTYDDGITLAITILSFAALFTGGTAIGAAFGLTVGLGGLGYDIYKVIR